MTKKEINEYGKKIEKILAECLPDYTVTFSERTMNNDITEYEISIFKKDSNAGRVTTVDIPTCIKKRISITTIKLSENTYGQKRYAYY